MLATAIPIIATSLAVTAIAVLLFDRPGRRLSLSRAADAPAGDTAVSFLFDGELLVDTTPSGRVLLSRGGGAEETFSALLAVLRPRFPDIVDTIDGLGRRGHAQLLAADGSAQLAVHRNGEQVRIDLDPLSQDDGALFVSAAEFDGLRTELARLRGIGDGLPYPVWREDAEGNIVWANSAYLALARTHDGAKGDVWPPRHLFDRPMPAAGEDGHFTGRLWLRQGSDAGLPYEVTVTPHADGVLCSAIGADSALRTENALRDLVQTLTKTFAQISHGVAVFSREKRMVLFNPALAEMTGLRPEDLALGPTFYEFLDTLRDRRLVPEPKDYKAWRSRLADVKAALATGGMDETWHLPDGRALRISILPQSEGAMALLLQDITGEVLQNRSFRGTLELHQLLLDRRDEAVAVFAQDHAMVLCNTAYDSLWHTDHGETVAPVTLGEAIETWRAATQPTPAWDDFPRDLVDLSARDGWCGNMTMTDGRGFVMQAISLSGGYIFVTFEPTAAANAPARASHRLQLMA